MPPRDKTTAQIRAISRRSGLDVDVVRQKLQSAGVQSVDGGPLYATTRVNLADAMLALKPSESPIPTAPTPSPTPSPIAALAADAAAVPKSIAPVTKYTGDETEGPPPEHIIQSIGVQAPMDFPVIPNPDADKVYRPVHISPDRQNHMVGKGYQFVKDPAHIARIGHGTLERYLNGRGHIQFRDRELMFMHLALATKYREKRKQDQTNDRIAVGETFHANVEAAKRTLGRGADTRLESFEMDEGDAIEKRDRANAKKQGVEIVDLGGKG